MNIADVFALKVLAQSPPYVVVKLRKDVFTILEEGLEFPFYEDRPKEDQWLDWLLEFSVSINGLTSDILQHQLNW